MFYQWKKECGVIVEALAYFEVYEVLEDSLINVIVE